jgi:long-chain acyl-CoA synthetase
MNFYDDLGVYGTSPALITESLGEISYHTLQGYCATLGDHLTQRTLAFCLCDNSPESVIGYLACLRRRVVPVLISTNTRPELIKRLLTSYHPRYLWMPQEKAISYPEFVQCFISGSYALFECPVASPYEIHEDLALLLTTSGSTGSPKFVRQSYKNICSNAESIAEYLKIGASDRPITTLPMSYTFGLSVLNSHLHRGSSIVLTNRSILEKEFWELLKRTGATTFSGVPYVFEMLKKFGFEHMEVPSLKKLTQAGGRLGPELSLEFASICGRKGIEFFVMYGQTEATARIAYLPSELATVKAGSIGVAIPGGRIWLEDEDHQPVPGDNTVGELVYSGDNVTMGYALSSDDLHKGDENHGILRTGDLARRDSDGLYYIVGRNKRILKLFGNRVNLDEIEHILDAQGYQCICGGDDDRLKIFTTDAGKEDEIKSFVISHTAMNQSWVSVVYIAKIPRNEYGRIKYSSLEQSLPVGCSSGTTNGP